MYTVYALIFAGLVFRELLFWRIFRIYNLTNGSLVVYISIIQKYVREDKFSRRPTNYQNSRKYGPAKSKVYTVAICIWLNHYYYICV